MDGEMGDVFPCGRRRDVPGWWSEAASRFCLRFVTGPVGSLLREINLARLTIVAFRNAHVEAAGAVAFVVSHDEHGGAGWQDEGRP